MPQVSSNTTSRRPTGADRFTGVQIRQARRELGFTQEDLASTLGLTFQQIQKYEAGHSRLSVGRLREVAIALGKPVGFFFLPVPALPTSQQSEARKLRMLQQEAKKHIDDLAEQADLMAAIRILSALSARQS